MNNFRIIDKLIKDVDFIVRVLERDSEPVFRTNLAQFEDLSFAIGDAVHSVRIIRQECLELLGYSVPHMRCQSGQDQEKGENEVSNEEQILFHDSDAQVSEVPQVPFVDTTRSLMDKSDVTLTDFFSRPIKIDHFDWPVAMGLNRTINPWSLYFNNPRVQNRLTNFELLRCNLKLKFMINGNPFYYGRLMVTYLPMHNYDVVSTGAATTSGEMILNSQRPRLFMNPTFSQGGDMLLPFFWHKNYLSITREDWNNMGQIDFNELNPLLHANGDTAPVTVTVMAWAEDVEVSILTSMDIPTMGPQSGTSETKQANTQGVISKPASAIAKKVSMLGIIPQFKPFAMATSMALEGMATMAKLLGYSRPNKTTAPEHMIQKISSQLATCNSVDSAVKLTVDDNQELTVDNRIAGIDPGDELSIAYIAQKESYLTTFNWQGTDNPDDLLFNMRLNPGGFFSNAGVATYMTSLALVTLPFEYWTGTLKVRFQFVVSAYHRGRVRISFDPRFQESSEYNTNYAQIVDITDQSDFTVSVGMAQDRSLLRVLHPDSAAATDFYSTTPFATVNNQCNGMISVYVLNELTSPSLSTPNIGVNVFVSAGDDFEVFVPGNYHSQYVLQPQSMTETNATSDAEHSGHTQLCIGTTNSDELNKVFIGESIQSLRTLLRRYVLHEACARGFGADNTLSAWDRVAFPYYRGNVPNPIHTTGALAGYNYCNTTLLNLLAVCFSGHRGSIRYKFLPQWPISTFDTIYTEVERRLPWEAGALSTVTSYAGVSTLSQTAAREVTTAGLPNSNGANPGSFGVVIQNTTSNPNLEVEIPFYSDVRFLPGKHIDYTSSSPLQVYEGYRGQVFWKTDNRTNMKSYVSIGEDFQMFFYTGPPMLYFEPTPPAA